MVEFLLDHGAYVNDTHVGAEIVTSSSRTASLVLPLINGDLQDGKTALMKAAHEGHVQVFRYLVERGADLNLQSRVLRFLAWLSRLLRDKFSYLCCRVATQR